MLTISLFMICRKTYGIFLKPLIPVKDGIRDFDVRQEKLTYQFVEDSIKRDCSNIENKLLSMKNKYKNNKDYSARLTVYDDTIIIYDEYKKTQIKNESNE